MEELLNLKRLVVNMTTNLVLQDNSGRKNTEIISECLEEACLRLGIGKKEYIRMFL